LDDLGLLHQIVAQFKAAAICNLLIYGGASLHTKNFRSPEFDLLPTVENLTMTRGKTAKTKKKSKPKNFSQTAEPPKIQKRNREKYSKNKVRNDARKAAARKIVLEELARKKAIESGKGTLFDGVTMDVFLEPGAGEPMGEVVPTPAMEASNGLASEEKDCSFYEFLKRVDRDLAELDTDELVEDEDYISEVTREGGLTSRMLSTWEPQLSEDKSLGTLKKTLIALKSAAHAAGTKSQNGSTKVAPVDSKGIP
jgi:hypothetical protein